MQPPGGHFQAVVGDCPYGASLSHCPIDAKINWKPPLQAVQLVQYVNVTTSGRDYACPPWRSATNSSRVG
uniref:ML domain-containing protein n=1 Tax=Globodera pallida TaxID=36090 RepID=A0A183BJ50_GLOPA